MGRSKWLWHLCLANMKQRGIRTFLTILGVIIGVVSIVSMLALGLGVKKQLLDDAMMEGSVTDITVYGKSNTKIKSQMLTDQTILKMSEIDHVEGAIPTLELVASGTYGNYDVWVPIVGVPADYMQQLNLIYGDYPKDSSIKPELLMGGLALEGFYNMTANESYSSIHKNDSKNSADKNEWKNLTGKEIKTVFYDGLETTANLKIVGVTDDYSFSLYCDIEVLKAYLKRNAENGIIYGQPQNEDGTAYPFWVYSSAVVKVDDIENVDYVVEKLQNLGFQTESNKEYVMSMQKTVKIMQLLLGGIGMIALIVAVIGIGNTMTTSVYERVNEIGVLKVLGCDPAEMMRLFLLESGILGGIGGAFGVAFSYLICEFAINKIAVKYLEFTEGIRIAQIPTWLAIGAIVFAIVLGIVAGYFPARWAAKLKPIDAMRK